LGVKTSSIVALLGLLTLSISGDCVVLADTVGTTASTTSPSPASSQCQRIDPFVDSTGKAHDIFAGRLVVLAFMSPNDVVSFAYIPTDESMCMKTASLGGEFFGVVSSGSSPPVVERFRRECKANFPVLLDRGKCLESLGTRLGAGKTGCVIVLRDNKCLYAGPIDHRFDTVSDRQDAPTLEEELDILARQQHAPRVMLARKLPKPAL